MSTLLKPILVREELLKRNMRLFKTQDFRRVFNTLPSSTKYFLETQVLQGFLLRFKRGIYGLKADSPAEEEIANALYQPSYISFEYALGYYHLLPEMPYTVTSATTKPTRLFTPSSGSFSFRTIKKEAFTGYSLIKQEQKSFLMAEKEKALVDYLYFLSLRKVPHNDRLKTAGLNKQKINMYAKLFKNERLLKLVETFV